MSCYKYNSCAFKKYRLHAILTTSGSDVKLLIKNTVSLYSDIPSLLTDSQNSRQADINSCSWT